MENNSENLHLFNLIISKKNYHFHFSLKKVQPGIWNNPENYLGIWNFKFRNWKYFRVSLIFGLFLDFSHCFPIICGWVTGSQNSVGNPKNQESLFVYISNILFLCKVYFIRGYKCQIINRSTKKSFAIFFEGSEFFLGIYKKDLFVSNQKT